MNRFLSDMYGRGVVWSAQESANLRAYRNPRDVTGAANIKTAKTAMILGAQAARMAERLCASGILETDKREGSKKLRIVSKSPVYLYGMELKYHPWL
eukprot:8514721-Pyramimonas_sp.AAC.1